VKTIARFLLQAVCLLLMAVGFVGALLATIFMIPMVIVWFQEGHLQADDKKILGEATKWLLIACVMVGTVLWLRCKIVGKEARDDSFRLVKSKSGNSENIFQGISDLVFVILLLILFWALIPGRTITKIPAVAGWLLLGFFLMHARIALHELGHLTAANLLGMELRKIQIGVGPLLWSRLLGNGLLCEWRAWLRGGFMHATHRNTTKRFRVRQFVFVAAGPLTDLFILWSTYQLITYAFGSLGAAFTQSACGLLVSSLFWWTAFSAVQGLIPYITLMNDRTLWTDGYWLFRLLAGLKAGFPQGAYDSGWKKVLELMASDPQMGTSFETKQQSPESFANSLSLCELRDRLSSRLLRQPSSISSPPA
jgi:Peptidase family M50